MKGVTRIPEQFKARVYFLGKTHNIGSYPSEAIAEEIVQALNNVIADIEIDARTKFDEQLGILRDKFATKKSEPVAAKKSEPVATKKREPVATKKSTKKSAKIEPPVWLQNHDNAKIFDLADLEGTNVRYDHVDETGRAVKNPFIHFRRASTEMWWCAGTPELVYTPHFNMFLVAVPESEVGECLAKYGLIMPAPAPAPAPAPTPAPVEEPNIEDRVDLPSRKGLFTRVDGLVIDLDKCEFFDYAARGDDKHPWVTVYDENDDWVINGRMINE